MTIVNRKQGVVSHWIIRSSWLQKVSHM